MIPAQLAAEVEDLRQDYPDISVRESDGWAVVVIPRFRVKPKGYTKSVIRLLLKVPIAYPHGKPDMFWTDVDFVLSGGRTPQNADQIETIIGEQWRRFSWHPQAWNPGSDNLRTFLEFVSTRLQKAA